MSITPPTHQINLDFFMYHEFDKGRAKNKFKCLDYMSLAHVSEETGVFLFSYTLSSSNI